MQGTHTTIDILRVTSYFGGLSLAVVQMKIDWIEAALDNGGELKLKRQGKIIRAEMRWEHLGKTIVEHSDGTFPMAVEALNTILWDDAASEIDV